MCCLCICIICSQVQVAKIVLQCTELHALCRLYKSSSPSKISQRFISKVSLLTQWTKLKERFFCSTMQVVAVKEINLMSKSHKL